MSKLSITGADDKVSIEALKKLAKRYPFLEHALLYFPEKEGAPRNPSKSWRQKFLKTIPKNQTAIHLCGEEAFNCIVDSHFKNSEFFNELKQYGRIQLNINARKDIFSHQFIHDVYNILLENNFKIILQYHERSKDWILPFLENYQGNNVDILLDASLGRGVTPSEFTIPEELKKYSYLIGIAGGINPDNIQKVHSDVKAMNITSYYLDLESGVRVNNEYDVRSAELLCDRFQT